MDLKTLEIDGHNYSCDDLIKTLKEQVLPQRLERIQSVIDQRSKQVVTVMENIYDRGNTSAVMRSAEAFGFFQFHHIVQSDEFKESKRVTQGADKWLIQKTWDQTDACVDALKEQGYKIYVTHLEGGTPLPEVSFDEPVALCFGNEKLGASPRLTARADEKVFIPMKGFVQSFNISVAAALAFQWADLHGGDKGWAQLSDEERQHLLALYLFRSCKNPKLPTPRAPKK